uniref:hypothetical protein n=1 Tax=Agathobacter sp. TaxID=2021311 RepID=UPI004056139E
MKLKTSFFNKGIFWKNVTLYWPIWAGYTLILLIALPGVLWVESNSWAYEEKLSERDMLSILGMFTNSMFVFVIIIAVMALITGCALFSYLFNARTANMIHALPTDRNQLFGTNVISGLAFLIVPQILTFAVAVLYCLNRGIGHLEYLVMWLFMSMVTAFVAYSIVTFCSFLTGQNITMVCFVALMNVFSFGVGILVSMVYEVFAFGVIGTIIPESVMVWCSPLASFFQLGAYPRYEMETYSGMYVTGQKVMLVYSIIALILYAAAWMLYKKRHIEHAGDLLTVRFLKPVFRWGVGFFGALTITPFIYMVFLSMGKAMPLFVFAILFAAIGMLCYWIADMLIKKTFKVFKKKYMVQWGIFCIFLIAGFGGIYLSTNIYETTLPYQKEVAYATMRYGYSCKFDKEELNKVFAVHEAIIENREMFEQIGKEGTYIENGYDYVQIEYFAEDGSIIQERSYLIPYNEEGMAIFKAMQQYEEQPEKFLEYLFGSRYREITTFGSGFLGIRVPDMTNPEMVELKYEQRDFDSNAAKVLYEAILADAHAGTLYPHNIYWRYSEVMYENTEAQTVSYDTQNELCFSYKVPESENGNINMSADSASGIWGEYADVASFNNEVSIEFGADCTNIMNALIELGLIASAEEIQN